MRVWFLVWILQLCRLLAFTIPITLQAAKSTQNNILLRGTARFGHHTIRAARALSTNCRGQEHPGNYGMMAEAGDEKLVRLETNTTPRFNGGKMIHIFKFDDETHMYATEVASKEASKALQHGRLYYKIDGCNGMLLRDGDDEFRAYQRLDTKGKPIPEACVPLPTGCNVDSYEGHSYCYEPISADVQGKKARKRNQAMLDVVEKHKKKLLSLGLDAISIEWVGLKFNKTPGVPHDVAIALHLDQVCNEPLERTYDGVRAFLLHADPPIEGLVVEFEGTYWKIRSDCFDRKCRFKTEPSKVRPPDYLF